MNVSKIFNNNDIYFMEIVSDKIVINDNYNGIFIIDYDLNIVKEMQILNDLSIDVSFIKDNEVVLYCYENQCLIHINIDTYLYKIICLGKELEDTVILPFYEWIGNDLMLQSANGNIIIHVDLLNYTVESNSVYNNDKNNSLFYDNCKKLSGKVIYKVYPNEGKAVVEKDNKIILYNYKDNEESILTVDPTDFYDNEIASSYIYHDIEVKNDIIVEVSEKKTKILYKMNTIILYPELTDYVFFSAKLITIAGSDYLFLLQGSNSDPQKAKIEKYDIELLFNIEVKR